MRIDSHQHFWSINETDYVWMTTEHDVIRRDFLPPDLAPLMDAAKIDRCVAVQARQTVAETEWLLDLSEKYERIAGVVGWVPLCEGAGEPYLERYAAHPGLVGVRHVVHDEPDDDFILRRDFNDGVARLALYGLTYDVLIFERHLPQTIAFVDRHPNQPFIVDHIAKPRIRREAFDDRWAASIRELARRDHVVCKVSGMVTEVHDRSWDVAGLEPYFETVLEAFGPARVLFGSDWPVCLLRASYSDWIAAVEKLTDRLGVAEKPAFWGANARRVYGM